MEPLVDKAWNLYHSAQDLSFVVKPSVPILFFGDSDHYFRSPLKVITVGLNPSRAEFPEDDPFTRFRPAQHVYPGILSGHGYTEYLHALNGYFRHTPYRKWFNSFEPILKGMNGSYYAGQPNTVLHTDLCSPLATDPTWSRLSDARAKLTIEAGGLELWLRLVQHLAPDVILISVARHYVQRLDKDHFPVLRNWETIHTISSDRANPYHVVAREVEIVGGKSALLVFGKASQTPFGTVKNVDKVEIGRCIEERTRER